MSFYPEDKPHQANPSSSILEASPSEYTKRFRGQMPPESFQMNINWDWRNLLMWFGSLPTRTKFIVGVLGLIFGYAIAQAVLKLVASIIGMALLLVLVYLGYKFWVSGAEQNQQ